jgi:hypothetical protein
VVVEPARLGLDRSLESGLELRVGGRPRQPARLPPSSAFTVEASGASMITPSRIAGSLKEAVILIVASVS